MNYRLNPFYKIHTASDISCFVIQGDGHQADDQSSNVPRIFKAEFCRQVLPIEKIKWISLRRTMVKTSWLILAQSDKPVGKIPLSKFEFFHTHGDKIPTDPCCQPASASFTLRQSTVARAWERRLRDWYTFFLGQSWCLGRNESCTFFSDENRTRCNLRFH